MILVTKTSDQTRQRGHTLSTCTNLTRARSTLCSPPLLPCCSLGYPSWQLLNQPFLFYIFFAFHLCLPGFPCGVYSYFAVSCAFSPPFRPPQSYSRSRYRRPRSHLRYSPRFCPRSRPRPRSHPRPRPRPRPHPVPAPVPVPVLRSFVRFHPRSRSRSVPVPLTVHVPVIVSVPTPDSNPAPATVRSFLPRPIQLPLGMMRLNRRRALRMRPSGARKRHPLSAEMVTRAE